MLGYKGGAADLRRHSPKGQSWEEETPILSWKSWKGRLVREQQGRGALGRGDLRTPKVLSILASHLLPSVREIRRWPGGSFNTR